MELKCLDRLYLHGSIGPPATGGGWVTFMRTRFAIQIPLPTPGAIETADEFGQRLYLEAWKRGWSPPKRSAPRQITSRGMRNACATPAFDGCPICRLRRHRRHKQRHGVFALDIDDGLGCRGDHLGARLLCGRDLGVSEEPRDTRAAHPLRHEYREGAFRCSESRCAKRGSKCVKTAFEVCRGLGFP